MGGKIKGGKWRNSRGSEGLLGGTISKKKVEGVLGPKLRLDRRLFEGTTPPVRPGGALCSADSLLKMSVIRIKKNGRQ